jgi:hypothetical protein
VIGLFGLNRSVTVAAPTLQEACRGHINLIDIAGRYQTVKLNCGALLYASNK